jgi:hypothetical protein
VGYGEALNNNLVHLLENFAYDRAPAGTPTKGQLWYDTFHQTLNVYTGEGTGYSPVSGIRVNSSFPETQKDGDIFFNTTTNQLYISSAGTFDLIGPLYTKLQGVSGAIPVEVNDGSISGVTHNIVQLRFGDTVIATFSSDLPFLPSPAIPGFTYINPGITLNSSLVGTTFNSNVAGYVTGDVTGNLTGNSTGTHTGAVIGNVTGNVTGNVVATTLSGVLTGDVTSTNGLITNLTSGNAQITGGSLTGLTTVSASNSTLTNLNVGTGYFTNLSVANLVVAGGSLSGLASLNVTNLSSTNFITANAQIASGNATGLTNLSATNGTFTNFSSGNIQVTGGSLTGIGGFVAASTQTTNFSTGNALITGGSLTGLTNLTATTGQATNFSSSNVLVTGGNISNTSGANNTLFGANLVNATATTKAYSDSSTAVATTAYVNSVLPRGAIIMWGGSIGSIPAGWQLCDGSNGSPDLRGQFIAGAGNAQYTVGATGGATSVTLTTGNLPPHTHLASLTGATNHDGAHNHTVIDSGHTHTTPGQIGSFFYYSGGGGNSGVGVPYQAAGTTGSSTTGITLAQASTHTHTVTLTGNVNSTGSGQSFGILPPYYALCYIQKMY